MNLQRCQLLLSSRSAMTFKFLLAWLHISLMQVMERVLFGHTKDSTNQLTPPMKTQVISVQAQAEAYSSCGEFSSQSLLFVSVRALAVTFRAKRSPDKTGSGESDLGSNRTKGS